MKKNIYALLGDYYHDHDLILNALQSAIEMLGGDIELHDIDTKDLSSALATRPDLVILNKENRLNPTDQHVKLWMTPDLETQIADYVRRGGSWLGWHAGLASYPEEGPFGTMLKGMFKFHPRVNKPVAYSSRDQEPLALGKPLQFEAIDEHYFVECDLENTQVFLESTSADGRSMAGWAHHFGDGRVLCITPTHRREGLTHPEVVRLLRDSISWLL
ncbi:ThuA domain-containing protein [Paenibacillus macerans]|uniref:ThuA domain-containing protein n=1 Tax=Paenibacillus macerans TaxID=44252 RepID=UPI003D32096A